VGGGYAWNKNRGQTVAEAFENIRALIIQIIQLSQEGNWAAIDRVTFHAIGKWKIVFLYSGKRLLPMYSDRALRGVAGGLGLQVPARVPIYSLQMAILEQRPPGEDLFSFAGRLYSEFAEHPRPRHFFVIGSNYNDVGSVMPRFLRRNCVAMGWIGWVMGSPMVVS
jgi:hypothetical protein